MIRVLLLCASLCMAAHAPAEEGFFAPQATAPSAAPSQAELDSLLAPIALYPDDLLAQVLAASTYPLEIVALDRWLDAHPGLSPDAVEAAMQSQPWDDSVKSLAPMRDVVAMMDGEIEWTQRLGDAFLASGADVMDAVQRLRRHARDAGTLQDDSRERVLDDGTAISIEPAVPETVYVPVYDPRVVYGPWWWPGLAPYAWGGFYFGGPFDFIAGGLSFRSGVRWRGGWHDGARIDWRDRHVVDRRPGRPPEWQHDPGHRGGAPYSNPVARDRFNRVDPGRVRDRADFRGFGTRPSNPVVRQQPPARVNPVQRIGPSPFAPVPNAQARQNAQRGNQSLGRAAPSAPPSGRSRGTKP